MKSDKIVRYTWGMGTEADTATIDIEVPAEALPPGGAAFAGEEEPDSPVSEDEGFTGKGAQQPKSLTTAQREAMMADAERHARAGTLPPRDKDGRFVLDKGKEPEAKPEPKRPKPEAEPADETDKESDADPKGEKKPAIPLDSPDMRRARKALLRDGYEPEDLAAWKPEEVLARGVKRADLQTKADKRFYELAKKAGEPTDRIEVDEPPIDNGAAEQAALTDLLFGRTTGQGGEGSTDELSDVWAFLDEENQGKVKSVVDHRDKALAKAREVAARAVGRAAALSVHAARNELLGDYPILKDPAKWDMVLQELAGLDRDREIVLGSDQERVTSLTRKAVFAAFGESIVTERRNQQVAVNKRERQSVPHEGNAPPNTMKGSLTKNEYLSLAEKAANQFPGDVPKARAWLNEKVGGREILKT